MNFRRLLFFPLLAALAGALALTFTGCHSLDKKKKKLPEHNMADQNFDTSFQSFVGRLQKAASKRDMNMLASMMTPDFGYSWAPGGEGPGVFEYWTRNNLWPQVSATLRAKFAPLGGYMVAPRDVTIDPDYKGYRAGLRLINGSWRFCYFVDTPPADSTGAQ